MTHLVLDPGICGHMSRITATARNDQTVRTTVETSCPSIAGIPDEFLVFDPVGELFGDGALQEKLRPFIQHRTCPFVIALLKAVEAEAGLALKKDISMLFSSDE